MRSLGLVIVLMLAGPSMAGRADGGLPGVGTFSYSALPLLPDAMVVATR